MELPIVCTRSDLPAAERERQRTLVLDLLKTALETRELENGFLLRFPAESLIPVAELVEIERCCCPFLDIRIETRAKEPGVFLTLEGPAGTKDVLRAELRLFS